MVNFVKTISTEIDSLGRRIVKFLRYGKNDVQTSNEATPFGVDSNPIKDMIAVYAPTSVRGGNVIIGYLNLSQVAEIGENRIYSTDEGGILSTFIHLKNDGTMHIGGDADFMVRYNELESAFNQLRDDFNRLVSDYNSHVHSGVTSGGASTAPTTSTGTPSNADITGAKIEEIKTL